MQRPKKRIDTSMKTCHRRPPLLLISRKWPPAIGGMETYSESLAQSLAEHFDLTLLVLPGRGDGRPPRLPAYLLFVVKAMLYCLFQTRKFQGIVFCDLLLFPAALVSRIVAPKRPRVVVVYGLDLVFQKRPGLLPAAYGMVISTIRRFQRVFSSIVAISHHTQALARQVGLDRVSVILPPVPDTPLTRSEPTSMVERPNGRIIFQFGRLVERKGAIWFAREVVPLLPDDVTFVVAGTATDKSLLMELESCKRTRYLGPLQTEALASWIRNADVVVMPNIRTEGKIDVEGFGLVAVETTSLGGILAAAELQGITDAVVDGVTGTLVEPMNPGAWRTAILSILNDDDESRDSRREKIARSTRDRFSTKIMGEAFRSLLSEVDGVDAGQTGTTA